VPVTALNSAAAAAAAAASTSTSASASAASSTAAASSLSSFAAPYFDVAKFIARKKAEAVADLDAEEAAEAAEAERARREAEARVAVEAEAEAQAQAEAEAEVAAKAQAEAEAKERARQKAEVDVKAGEVKAATEAQAAAATEASAVAEVAERAAAAEALRKGAADEALARRLEAVEAWDDAASLVKARGLEACPICLERDGSCVLLRACACAVHESCLRQAVAAAHARRRYTPECVRLGCLAPLHALDAAALLGAAAWERTQRLMIRDVANTRVRPSRSPAPPAPRLPAPHLRPRPLATPGATSSAGTGWDARA